MRMMMIARERAMKFDFEFKGKITGQFERKFHNPRPTDKSTGDLQS
jgi:hypothetical protein